MDRSVNRIETSAITLSRVGRNDPTLTKLILTPDVPEASTTDGYGYYWPSDGNNLSTLGDVMNTNLQQLSLRDIDTLEDIEIAAIGVGVLKRNTSPHYLEIESSNLSGVMGRKILNGLVANNSNLEQIWISCCDLSRNVFSPAISKGSNVNLIRLSCCAADDDIIVDFVSGIRGLPELSFLDLYGNIFGRVGCEALATLLQEPNSNLVDLLLYENDGIDEDCAIILANSLVGNNKLECLYLPKHVRDIQNVGDAFSKVLCNTATVNDTYHSNHTLSYVKGQESSHALMGIRNLLHLNANSDKRQVALLKILCHHSHIDMGPFLEPDMKMLPVVIIWFDRARGVNGDIHYRNGDGTTTLLENLLTKISPGNAESGPNKLSAIYQFVRAVPLKCVPSPTTAGAKRNIEAIS